MRLIVTGVDYNPPELDSQIPFSFNIIRMLSGPDQRNYWLCKLDRPISWIYQNQDRKVVYLIVAARWQGTEIKRGIRNFPINIAYVKDPSLITDSQVVFDKCEYVAVGFASSEIGSKLWLRFTDCTFGKVSRYFRWLRWNKT